MKRTNLAVLSVSAQEDNLGDIEIRERLFNAVRSTGMDMLVYRGGNSDSYIEAFSGQSNCRWYKGLLALQCAVVRGLMTGHRLHFFMAPGPAKFNSNPLSILKSVSNLLNISVIRFTGGTVHIVGRAYRGDGLTRFIEQATLRLSNSASVRDTLSRENAEGIPVVVPDLGFNDCEAAKGARPYFAISVREEPDLNESDFEALCKAASSLKLRPIFVTQVKRDGLWMKRMASRFAAEFVEWKDDTHCEQRLKVKEIYRASTAIASNRLHGLIIGANLGAFPIPIISHGNDKLLPTLDVVFDKVPVVHAKDLRGFDDLVLSEMLAGWSVAILKERLSAARASVNFHLDKVVAMIK